MKNNQGFALVTIIIGIVAFLAIGGAAYYVIHKNNSNSSLPATTSSTTTSTTVTTSTSTSACNPNSPSTIKVLSPNGGEVYQGGQQITVTWKSCNVTPNSIGIILIKHDSSAYTQSEGQNDYGGFSLGSYSTADDGVEQITLPPHSNPNLSSGQHYFISVIGLGDASHIGSGYSPRDYSDNLFTIQ